MKNAILNNKVFVLLNGLQLGDWNVALPDYHVVWLACCMTNQNFEFNFSLLKKLSSIQQPENDTMRASGIISFSKVNVQTINRRNSVR